MKNTENLEQLLERFYGRQTELSAKQKALDESYKQWVELDRQLNYLTGCIETVVYQAYGKLPRSAFRGGGHEGLKDHQPKQQ